MLSTWKQLFLTCAKSPHSKRKWRTVNGASQPTHCGHSFTRLNIFMHLQGFWVQQWPFCKNKLKRCLCTHKWQHEISNNLVSATTEASDQHAHLIRAFACRFNILWLLSCCFNIICSFYAIKEAAQARLSLHLSKCHIVWNLMSRLKLHDLSSTQVPYSFS